MGVGEQLKRVALFVETLLAAPLQLASIDLFQKSRFTDINVRATPEEGPFEPAKALFRQGFCPCF